MNTVLIGGNLKKVWKKKRILKNVVFIYMKPNYHYIFHKRLLAEAEVRTKIETESNLEKILDRSKKITSVLSDLLTSQKNFNEKSKNELREIVADIRFMSYRPTTFRIIFKNGNYFDLKYDPSPLQLKYPGDYEIKDSFLISVSGKKYNLANRSELEQALDYINVLLKTGPILKEPEPIQEPGEAPPETPPSPEEAPPPPEGEEKPPEETPEK
jgi:hypothetical protein